MSQNGDPIYEHEHQGWVVFNPHGKPILELPAIYVFNNGGPPNYLQGYAMAQNGVILGEHICSHEGYMIADLACVEGWQMGRHHGYKKHYPDGYRMEFVLSSEIASHEGLQRALRAAREGDCP